MMMPRIFGENLFDDFMNDFVFPDFTDSANIEKALYGKHEMCIRDRYGSDCQKYEKSRRIG